MNPQNVPLERLVEERHSDHSQWVVIREFRAGVGYSKGADRRIDVAAFCCWPSKGLRRIAYEIKRSRGDFVKEIDNPKKRQWVEENFHQTYFVVPHGLVKPEEIPESWGLLVATQKADKLIRRKIATHREVSELPELIALSAIRAVCDQMHRMKCCHYYFEGMWLRQEQVDSMIEKDLSFKRETMDNVIEKHKLAEERFKAKIKELEAPLRKLAYLVGDRSRFTSYYADSHTPVTVQDVTSWVERVRSKAVISLLSSLQHCADSIENVLSKAREEDFEGVRKKTERELSLIKEVDKR